MKCTISGAKCQIMMKINGANCFGIAVGETDIANSKQTNHFRMQINLRSFKQKVRHHQKAFKNF